MSKTVHSGSADCFRYDFLALLMLILFFSVTCEKKSSDKIKLVFPASAVGKESDLLNLQLERFMSLYPNILGEQRVTQDASDIRHHPLRSMVKRQAKRARCLADRSRSSTNFPITTDRSDDLLSGSGKSFGL